MFSYDNQIAYLKENPDMISDHWSEAKGIFKFVGEKMDDEGVGHEKNPDNHGCITMIKGGGHVAYINGEVHLEITQKIKEDPRIPSFSGLVTVEDLELFKEYQEYADSLINQ